MTSAYETDDLPSNLYRCLRNHIRRVMRIELIYLAPQTNALPLSYTNTNVMSDCYCNCYVLRIGFEPMKGVTLTDLQSAAFDRSATSDLIPLNRIELLSFAYQTNALPLSYRPHNDIFDYYI